MNPQAISAQVDAMLAIAAEREDPNALYDLMLAEYRRPDLPRKERRGRLKMLRAELVKRQEIVA